MNITSEFLQILGKQSEITEQLIDMSSSSKNKAVSKNIKKSPNSTFDDSSSSKLTSAEKTRADEISNIFIRKYFLELKKHEKDTVEKTKVVKLKDRPTSLSGGIGGTSSQKTSGNLLSSLLSLLGLAGLSKYLAPGAIKQLLKTGLSKLWTVLKNVIGKLGKSLKNIIVKVINGLKKVFGKIWSGIKKLTSKLWSGVKSLSGKIWSKLKSIMGKIGASLSKLWTNIKSSNAWKKLSSIVTSSKDAISNFFKGVKSKISSVLKSIGKGISSVVPEGAKAAAKTTGSIVKSAASSGWNVLKNVGGGLWSATKATGSAIGSAAKTTGKVVKSVGSTVGGITAGVAKSGLSKAASGVIKGSGGMFKLMGKLAGKGAAKIPIIGPAIEAIFAAGDIKGMKARYEKGEMSLEDLQQHAGKRVIEGVGGAVGSAALGALGATLGSIIPVAGNLIGAIVGGVLGDYGGRFLGGLISDHILPKRYSKSIGAFVTNTPPPSEEMQDFIIRNGQIYKFNSKDEVMGMKQGGAINSFLRGDGRSSVLMYMAKAQKLSNEYLKNIAQNTYLMAKNNKIDGARNNISIPLMNNFTETPVVPIMDNRDGYLSSPYSLA